MSCIDCDDTGFIDTDPYTREHMPCPSCRPDYAPSPNRLALKHSTFMAVAVAISKLSTCRRLQVGCVLLGDDGRVLGTGYNGALPGREHCDAETCGPGKRCLRTRHAERSARDYSQGLVARCYVTHEPCVRCTQDLIARGCREVYYLVGYEGADDEKTWRQRHVDEAGVVWVQMRRDFDLYTV